MTIPKQRSDSTTRRYQRYLPVIERVSAHDAFPIAAVHRACDPEKRGFVTRVVNELVGQGWLLREATATDQTLYRWNTGLGEFSAAKWLDEKLFGNQIKLAPQQDRPRERLLAQGAENLRTAELFAILVRSGRPGESAMMAGERLANEFAEKLDRLPTAGRGELKSISPAVEKTAYCQIMAGIELGRRIAAMSEAPATTKICSTAEAAAFCRRHFARLVSDMRREEFHIVTLDTKNQVIDTHCITVGTLDASLVHPREVFRAAIKDAAQSIVLVHNHPSGDPSPSPEDFAVTRRLESAGETIGISVLDHIVLGRQGHVSIRQGAG
ncbi:hypothetical protein Poly24_30370 [Rosistilla carotiformis]|uniref:MPN domain-containing protein n=1 Tax=Rosistilla carotiformis TaxID=2528017 RepID=A0A518JUV1_9BACT|nr:DNA repair protein RadC [Rosistilla carotiformis]QDV69322.1 hypothetical protein Poly24_30370 [Rosistilla carotiformis]